MVAVAGAELPLGFQAAPVGIDVAANARALEQLLELADHLPQRHEPELRAPVFRDLAA
jgi:Asp-tRNA(Asn)/Glu-tRNA(Gln) amidotransferase A subunit family amidase